MSNVTKYVRDAFKSLDLLEDTEFELDSKEDFEELDDFINADGDIPEREVIDLDAETKEDVKDSYIGQAILECPVCHDAHFKIFDDVAEYIKNYKEEHDDEDPELVFEGEACPVCGNEDGYKVIGKVASVEFADSDKGNDDEDVEVEVKEKEEVKEALKRKVRKSLKESKKLKEENYHNYVVYNSDLDVLDAFDTEEKAVSYAESNPEAAWIDHEETWDEDRMELVHDPETIWSREVIESKKSPKGKKLKESTVMGVDIDDEALQSYVNSLSEGDNITVTADLLGVLESSLEIIKKSTGKTSPSKGTSYSGKLRLTNLSDVPLAVSNDFDRIGLENDILDCTTPDEVLEAARKNNKYLNNLKIHKDNRSFTVISGVDGFGNQHFLIAYKERTNESKRDHKGKKLEEDTWDVTDQIILKRNEPGVISKMHELRDQGYSMSWCGNGLLCFAKPKKLSDKDKIDPVTGEILESKKSGKGKKLTEEVSHSDVVDILGIEEDNVDPGWVRTVVREFNDLVDRGNSKGNIWLADDFGAYVNGEIVDKSRNLIVVKESKKSGKGRKLKEATTIKGLENAKNVAEEFKNYAAYKANFKPLVITKQNKEYFVYKEGAETWEDHTTHGTKEYVEGWMEGAIKAKNKRLESIKRKSKKKLKEMMSDSYVAEPIQREIERIIENSFNGTDFWASIQDIDFDRGKLLLSISALDSDEDGEPVELEREVEFDIPNLDIEGSLGDQLLDWQAKHSSPDDFYESRKSRRGKKLKEDFDIVDYYEHNKEVPDIAYEMASEISDRFSNQKEVTWDEFNAAFEEAYPGVVDWTEDAFNELETDVRVVLSQYGWATVYEGENEGGLTVESHKSRRGKKLTEAPVYELRPQYDNRQSFYGKAQVDTGDKNDKNKLYSYGTLVAEIKDGKPVVYGTYSQTTLRHIKDWLKQNGFKAETSKQIITDYGVKDECVNKQAVTESSLKKFRNNRKLKEATAEKVTVKWSEVFNEKQQSRLADLKGKKLDRETAENISKAIDKHLSGKGYELKDFLPQIDFDKEVFICNVEKADEDSLQESIESATIETKDQVINVSSEDKEENMLDDFDPDFSNFDEAGESNGEEMIAPLSDEEVSELSGDSEEEETAEDEEEVVDEFPEDEEEFEFDEVQEESFNRLVGNYLNNVYSNAKSFKLKEAKSIDGQLKITGTIDFKSGKSKDTTFIFEKVANRKSIAKNKARFVGLNETFTDKKNAYVLRVSVKDKKLVAESLRYDYPAKGKLNESVKTVKGLVK